MKMLFVVPALLILANPVLATQSKITATFEHNDFTEDHGDRNVTSVESSTKFNSADATLVLTGSYGERDFGDGSSFSGNRLGGQVYKKWSDTLYTRSAVSVANSGPVFADRDYAQDFNLKAGRTIFLLGARYTNHYSDVTVKAYSAGVTQYVGKRLSGSYRFTHYASDKAGSNNGSLVSLKLKDSEGDGNLQLWMGYADTLYAYDWLPTTAEGKLRNIVVRRVQPLNEKVSLNMSFGRSWYQTGVGDYAGVTGGLGVTYAW